MSAPVNFGEVQEGLLDALNGKGYTGPEIEWTNGTLAATTPEPHIRLDPEYMSEDDDPQGTVLGCAVQIGIEQGYRMALESFRQPLRYAKDALEEMDRHPDLAKRDLADAIKLFEMLAHDTDTDRKDQA
jgi:hypothetical protein